ncbi:MAG: hypothetical protein NTW14_08325 [bacterium]|nr:hypothetical protein [bacterium]
MLRNHSKIFAAIGLGITSLFLFTIVIFSANRPEPPKYWFGSSIDVNQDPGIVPVLASDHDMIISLNNSAFRIYPGSYMKNEFMIANKTDDTLRIATTGQTILQLIKFKYTYRGDSLSQPADIPFKYVEIIKCAGDVELPTWGKGNFLPPHAEVQIDAAVGWDELVKLGPGIVDFRWVFDNSSEAAKDSTITLAQYSSKVKPFRIIKTLETRYDSVYSFSLQAKRLNGAQRFDEALEYCDKILQMDSSNYTAIECKTDVLWKQSRFDEALVYAFKGKALLEKAADSLRANNMIVTCDDEGTFVNRMNFFITKCRNREKWKWAK